MKDDVGSQAFEDRRSEESRARPEVDRRAVLVGLGAGAPLLAAALATPAAAQSAQQAVAAGERGAVQASIQLLVDFHGHLGETEALMALGESERKDFLRRCARALHGERLPEFVELSRGPEFNPKLDLDASGHPRWDAIRTALRRAVEAYNRAGFGLQFVARPDPNPTCIRWVWINGEWRAVYNYDLVANDPPKAGELAARYHVSLTYAKNVAEVAGLSS